LLFYFLFLELLCTKPTDLAILLDTSASLDSKWQNVLRFTTTLVEGYDIGLKKTKVSIGTFGGGKQQIIMRFNTLTGIMINVIFFSWFCGFLSCGFAPECPTS